ncbi:hypothetical protein LWI29_008370 [Acer saccharum]|uniref:Fe2OG dioxygenase domain-containing protein n=1 Tax=Acer saccharum TaxID=4024 RepID=A0AA39W8M6_ACESA|nr:hypothetical protein LWI29_008370 [Acer saccharum]
MAAASTVIPIDVGHIDDVQELWRTKPTTVPERFVRDVTERPTTLDSTTTQSSPHTDIPIIDLSKLVMNGNPDDFKSEILNLTTACQDWGFFQVVNHGIDLGLLESIEKVAKDFFMLPLEEKQKYPMDMKAIQGYGQAFVFSENQKIDWCNMFALGLEPEFVKRPELLPSKPADFSETLESYSREVKKLCKNLLKYIAVTVGLKEDVFEEMFGDVVYGVRMNYYPPCSRPDLVNGLSPHSDGSAITVLQQQGKGSYAGLQILKDNTWVPVQPILNALVVNIGDTIQVLTNGKYKSVEHRAVTHKEKDRLSITTFYSPGFKIELGPMPEFVDENNPCKYKRYIHGEYSKHYITNKLRGKKNLDFVKI